MGCRCSDIAVCRKDIDKLSFPVSASLGDAQGRSGQATQHLASASQNLSEAVNTDGMGGIEDLLGSLNDGLDDSIPDLTAKCGSEITRLGGKLAGMQGEDELFHASAFAIAR